MKTNKNCPMYRSNPVNVAPTDKELAEQESSLVQDDLVKVEGTKVSPPGGVVYLLDSSPPGGAEQGGGRARSEYAPPVAAAALPKGQNEEEASPWR